MNNSKVLRWANVPPLQKRDRALIMTTVMLTLIFNEVLEDISREVHSPIGKEEELMESMENNYHKEHLSESFQLCQPNFISQYDRLLDKEMGFHRPSTGNLQKSLKISLQFI